MIDDRLAEFFYKLDRSLFLDDDLKPCAGLDRPLPIGFGQTISQPSLVLDMTRALALDKNCRVLEIGTGSGYQTAFLAEFAGSVYTVELIAELSAKAEDRLRSLGYANVFFKVGDGSLGWREHAPYDRVIVTAAAGALPEELAGQLAAGGKMIVPVGPRGMQLLKAVIRLEDGTLGEETLYPVTFVEMKGRYGWNDG